MNHKQVLEASKHNPAGVNKVLERLEWDCPECGGSGYEEEMEPLHEIQKDMDRDGPMEKCDECDDGKIHYSYSPQVGEWCISRRGRICLIKKIETSGVLVRVRLISPEIGDIEQSVCDVTPILEWETIEEILEKARYFISVNRGGCIIERPRPQGWCTSDWLEWKRRNRIDTEAKSRLPAVYEAVLALGKELK